LKEDLKEGLQGEIAIETTNDMAPPHLAEKGNFVYSTPSMVAHMERASLEAISAYLDENETSVGVKVNISHIASTKIGETVRVTSKLITCQAELFSMMNQMVVNQGFFEVKDEIKTILNDGKK